MTTVDTEIYATLDRIGVRIDELKIENEHLKGQRDTAIDIAWELECILRDLLDCRSEQRAIGGGPGWKERDAKAWMAAEEFFQP